MRFVFSAFADEAGASLSEQISALLGNGIGTVELRGVDGKNVIDLTDSEAYETHRRLSANGISVWSIGSPLGKIDIGDAFDPHFDKFKRTVDLAGKLGAENIRLFSFFIPKDSDPENYYNEVVERLSRFVEYAKGSGVDICHENEKGIYGDIAPRCEKLHKAIPGLKAIFDPANYIQCAQPTLPAWELISPYIKYMHIKDARADGFVVPPGKGEGHIVELLAKYRDMGGGTLTLEPHLKVFSGLASLERDGERTEITDFTYPSNRAAFDAASNALKDCIAKLH